MKKKESAKIYIKKYRLKQRILSMLKKYDNCTFLTFTFRPKTLKTTTQKTRERFIKAYLNDQAKEYILNIDFGESNGREHYHAIATPKHKIFLYDVYNKHYGLIQGERIGKLKRFTNVNKSIDDIAERLMNHATKETTNNNKVIYSRLNKAVKDSKYKNKIDYKLFWLEEEKERTRMEKEINKDESINNDFDINEYLKDLNPFY